MKARACGAAAFYRAVPVTGIAGTVLVSALVCGILRAERKVFRDTAQLGAKQYGSSVKNLGRPSSVEEDDAVV